MNSDKKPRRIVEDRERVRIDRSVIIWLNQCHDVPVATVTTESHLGVNEPGMAISSITNAYISKSYITGGYQAEYQFTLIYRIKPGTSMDKSLMANETLNRIGDWARSNKPELGAGIRVLKVEPVSIAQTYALYEGGDEDHHIPIKITYEVT